MPKKFDLPNQWENGGGGGKRGGTGPMLVLVLVLVLVFRHLQNAAVRPPCWCSHPQCFPTHVLMHRLWACSQPTP